MYISYNGIIFPLWEIWDQQQKLDCTRFKLTFPLKIVERLLSFGDCGGVEYPPNKDLRHLFTWHLRLPLRIQCTSNGGDLLKNWTQRIQQHHASRCVSAFNEKFHLLVGINFIHFNTQPINQPLPMELRLLEFLGFSRGTTLVSTVKVLYTWEEPIKRLKWS